MLSSWLSPRQLASTQLYVLPGKKRGSSWLESPISGLTAFLGRAGVLHEALPDITLILFGRSLAVILYPEKS